MTERGEKNSKDLIRWLAICYYILLYINTDNAIQFPFLHMLKSKRTEGQSDPYGFALWRYSS